MDAVADLLEVLKLVSKNVAEKKAFVAQCEHERGFFIANIRGQYLELQFHGDEDHFLDWSPENEVAGISGQWGPLKMLWVYGTDEFNQLLPALLNIDANDEKCYAMKKDAISKLKMAVENAS